MRRTQPTARLLAHDIAMIDERIRTTSTICVADPEETNGPFPADGTNSVNGVVVWHCDRSGEYSWYSSDLQNENTLRGVQETDGNGQVTFQTIYPACHSGRYPHIHVEIYKSLAAATGQANALLTTQTPVLAGDVTDGYTGSITIGLPV